MTSRLQDLLCFAFFVLLATHARSATIHASAHSEGCCPSAFDQSTLQVTPTQTTAYAAVSGPNYALGTARAQFSLDTGIRLGVFSYARTDASIGGAFVQVQAGFFDNITVLAGTEGSFEWTFALHGTLTSAPGGCSIIDNGPYS